MVNYIKSYSISTDTMTTVLNNNAGTIHFNQGDLNATQLNITLTHNNTAMDVTTATSISVVFQKTDGTTSYQDLTNGVSITNATLGQIQVSLNTQTLSVPGQVLTEVRITFPNNQVLITEKFTFTVESDILTGATTPSSNSYIVFLQVVTSLPTPSATYRFLQYAIKGGTGVADAIYICKKLSDDTYDWVQIG